MEANKVAVLDELLLKTDKESQSLIRYSVPTYQRKYVWDEKDCIKLIDDIFDCVITGKEHFIGTFVCQEIQDNSGRKTFAVVDGQQRLLTLLLIIKALSINYTSDDSGIEKILLDNEELRFIPSIADVAFKRLIFDEELNEIEKCSKINLNFLRIKEYLKEKFQGYALKDILYDGINKLEGVLITLAKEEDAQEVFESINYLGVPLTNADLIRNFLLMTLDRDKQKDYYDLYWKEIESAIYGEENINDFMRNYLFIINPQISNDANIYKSFKGYAFSNKFTNNGSIDRKKILIEMKHWAMIYRNLVKPCENNFLQNKTEEEQTEHLLLNELIEINQTTVFPFIMRVLEDKDRKNIPIRDINKVLNLIITYIVRRSVCEVPSASLRSFMNVLYKNVFRIEENYKHYYEAVYTYLNFEVTGQNKMPTEQEFLKSLKFCKLYRKGKVALNILKSIENGRYLNIRPEQVILIETIEHIMPQKLNTDWRHMLSTNNYDPEEIHEKYLDTIGNLSLASQKNNSRYSNKSFEEKKINVNEWSACRILNEELHTLNQFTENEIEARADRLIKIVKTAYELDSVSKKDIDEIQFENIYEVICDDLYVNDIFVNAVPVAFKLCGYKQKVSSYKELVQSVCKILYEKNQNQFEGLLKEKYKALDNCEYATIFKITDASQNINKNYVLINNDVAIRTSYRSKYLVYALINILKQFNIRAEELSIYLKEDSIKDKELKYTKAERVKDIRDVLVKLNKDKIVLYDYDNMPKWDEYIKFQIPGLNNSINKNIGEFKTSWDRGKYASHYYLEYCLKTNEIFITFKNEKPSYSIGDKIKSFQKELNFEIRYEAGAYWHINPISINIKRIASTNDKKSEIYKQIKDALVEINEFANKFTEFLECN